MAERALATAFVNIVPGTKEMEAYLKSGLSGQGATAGANLANSMSGGFGSKLKSSFMPILGSLGVAFGAVGVANFAKDMYQSAVEGQKVDSVLSQVAGSMGLFAGETDNVVSRLQNFATEQMKLTGIDDDLIKSAQTKLLTFANLADSADTAGGAFDRATKLTADMATVFGGDASSQSVILGKALNDPIKGLASLSRVGVQFTDGQKKMIEGMVEAGDVAGAQEIILQELETQVGGTAEASATAGEKMAARWDDAVQNLGTTMMPVFEGIIAFITDNLVPTFETASDGVKGFLGWFGDNQGWLIPVLSGIGTALLGISVYTAAAGIAAGVAAAGGFPAIITATWLWTAALLANPVTWIILGIGLLVGALVALAMNWEEVTKWVGGVWKGFTDWLDSSLKSIAQWWTDTWDGVASFFSDTWDNIVGFAESAWEALNDGVRDAIDAVVTFFKELPDKIKGALDDAATWLVTIGKNIIDGLMNGLKGAWNGVMDWASDVANSLSDTFKKVLGIKSPSRVFESHGKNIGEGLVKGMDSMQTAVEKSASELGSFANKGFTMSLKELTEAGAMGVLAGSEFFKATDPSQMASMLSQGGALNVNGVTMADIDAALNADAAGLDQANKTAQKTGKGFMANPALKALLEKAGYSFEQFWSKDLMSDYTQDLLTRLNGGFSYKNAGGGYTASSGITDLTSEYLNSGNNSLRAGTTFDATTSGAIQTFIDKTKSVLAAVGAGEVGADTRARLAADLAKAEALLPMARGGFVNRPTRALIGEAGPEVVTPLKDFERMMGIGNFERAQQKVLHYHAAPNQSFDNEKALFQAMRRGKVLAGW